MNRETLRHYAHAGPRRMRCLLCGAVIPTNALARSGHERGQQHQDALTAAAQRAFYMRQCRERRVKP